MSAALRAAGIRVILFLITETAALFGMKLRLSLFHIFPHLTFLKCGRHYLFLKQLIKRSNTEKHAQLPAIGSFVSLVCVIMSADLALQQSSLADAFVQSLNRLCVFLISMCDPMTF